MKFPLKYQAENDGRQAVHDIVWVFFAIVVITFFISDCMSVGEEQRREPPDFILDLKEETEVISN